MKSSKKMTKAGSKLKNKQDLVKNTSPNTANTRSKEWEETFDAVTDIIALISPDYEFIKLNKAGCEILGKNPEDLKGKKCYEIVHGSNSPPEDCPCVKLHETKKGAVGEISERGRHYIATASPIHDEKNQSIKAFAHTIKDITERKEAEETLQKSRENLERLVTQRTSQLEKANKHLRLEIDERKKIEDSLRKVQTKLKEQKSILAHKNIALKEIVTQIEKERRAIEEDVKNNIHGIIVPLVQRLRFDKSTETSAAVLQHHLEGITSSFGIKITDRFLGLSTREIEICSLVKAGLSNKEIGDLLHISHLTVEGHRKKIRKKLCLSNSGINLTSYLKKL